MNAVRQAADEGRLVLGICNGFQVLTEARLLPGALLRNENLQFRCERVALEVRNNTSPFTAGYHLGEVIHIPIAHGEGRYHADEVTLADLQAAGQIAFAYQHNPNGSLCNIAGVLNAKGNVLGLMPHPERAVAAWMGSEDGIRLFQSMHTYVTRQRPSVVQEDMQGGVHAG
jgi:phosphoribosylformylglycinamidine synthase